MTGFGITEMYVGEEIVCVWGRKCSKELGFFTTCEVVTAEKAHKNEKALPC